MAKQKLDKELALKIAKAGKKAAKELGATPNKKPHK
jgi:hypothetical protein